MTARRFVILIIVALTIIVVSYLVQNGSAGSSASAAISIGFEDSLPAPRMKTTQELIEFWRGGVVRDPYDYISLTYLGQSFMRRARETGDVADYERAEAALRKALELNPNYELALAYLASVQYVKHDFAGALQLAQRVYAFDPQAVQALATIGDAQMELGKYVEAESAYRQLLERSPSAPVYSRLSRLAWLHGQVSEALEWMERASDDAANLSLSGESAAWYQLQLGELHYHAGHADEAEKHYEQALKLFDRYYLALAGLGKVRAAQGRYAEAIELYEQAVAIIPQPELLGALGDLYTLTGQPEQAQHQYDTVQFVGKLAAINQVVYNRQLALFNDNHDQKLEEALDLTAKELTVRKDIYSYDAMAWSLYKNGRAQEAVVNIGQAMKLGTRDALIYYHAGMIYEGLGDYARARAMLSEALAINPHFDLLQSRVAQATLEKLTTH